MTDIANFDPKLLKKDKKSYKNNDIYYIRYITMKDFDYVKIKSVKLLYLIISEVDGHIEEKNGSKYFFYDSAELRSTEENKKVLKRYTKLWDEIKNEIETIHRSKKVNMVKSLWK